jgi:hypothetical protein
MRRVPRLILALALLTTGPLACAGGSKMTKIEVPAAGVKLDYDLAPGARFQGRVRVGETISANDGSRINRSLDAELELEVLKVESERGDVLVAARIRNLDLDWRLPPEAPISLEEFLAGPVSKIEGAEVRFNVSSAGEISNMPPPPQDVDDQTKAVFEQVLDAIESAFLEVPTKTLAAGETWTENEERGRKGKLGRYRKGTITSSLDGMVRDPASTEEFAQLQIRVDREEVITTKDGSHANDWDGKTKALFSVSGRYLAQIRTETTKVDPTVGTTFSKVQVDWAKRPAAPGSGEKPPQTVTISDPCNDDYVGPEECKTAVPEGTEVQAISDPCNDDYVGPEECKDAPGGEGTLESGATQPPAAAAPNPATGG